MNYFRIFFTVFLFSPVVSMDQYPGDWVIDIRLTSQELQKLAARRLKAEKQRKEEQEAADTVLQDLVVARAMMRYGTPRSHRD